MTPTDEPPNLPGLGTGWPVDLRRGTVQVLDVHEDVPPPQAQASQICPYRGLEPFTVADAAWFHGRARAVDMVVASLRRDRRFLALLGPSGSGKSSLIHADGPSSDAAITVLPLVEFTLTELWHRREDGRLTHHAYQQIGGMVSGLARWYDQAYQAMPPAQQPLVRRIVTSLVRLGDEATNIPPTRHRRTLAHLRADKAGTPRDSDSDVDTVVTALADRRLLITSRDPTNDEPRTIPSCCCAAAPSTRRCTGSSCAETS